MNTKHIILLATLLGVATVAAAQGPPMDAKQKMSHPMGGLNLTEEQQSKMGDLRLKHLKEIEPLQADLQKQESAMKLEMTADKFNESKVKSIQAEISKLRNEMAWKMITHRRAVRDMLTPDQQKKFDTMTLSGGGPGAGMRRGPGMGGMMGMGQGMGKGMMGMGQGMGKGMMMRGGMGMGAGMGMQHGKMMDKGECPCKGQDDDKDEKTPEPKK